MANELNFEIEHGGNFDGALITFKDAEGAPYPLAGWSAMAQVRKDSESQLMLDLNPQILPDDADGLVTIPPRQWSELMHMKGSYRWDMTLVSPTGARYPKKTFGLFKVDRAVITQ
jgi:hypothetical protein